MPLIYIQQRRLPRSTATDERKEFVAPYLGIQISEHDALLFTLLVDFRKALQPYQRCIHALYRSTDLLMMLTASGVVIPMILSPCDIVPV